MNKFIKVILIIIGSISVALGVLGLFLPILPTTPFLLLGAVCYIRSSRKLYLWLINNRVLGTYVRNYYEGNGIPQKTKAIAIILLWVSIGYTSFFLISKVFVRIVLLLIASAVTIHILSQKTLHTNS